MKLQAKLEMTQMTQKRLKTKGAWSLVGGRRIHVQLMLDFEERRRRAREEAAAAADADVS